MPQIYLRSNLPDPAAGGNRLQAPPASPYFQSCPSCEIGRLLASVPRPSIGTSVEHVFSATSRTGLSHTGVVPKKNAGNATTPARVP
jgi:hypothetical protein